MWFYATGILAKAIQVRSLLLGTVSSSDEYALRWVVGELAVLLLLAFNSIVQLRCFGKMRSLKKAAAAAAENANIEDGKRIHPSTEDEASVFSRLTFSWINGLIMQGNKKWLENDDVWDLSEQDKSAAVLAKYYAI
ncbi:hypothetical protein HK102_009668, partial [Quaeritorhiza haematococci]